MNTDLYYIVEAAVDDNPLDSVVEATSAAEAISLWQDYWDKKMGLDRPTPKVVYRLPKLQGKPQVYEWDSKRVTKVYSGPQKDILDDH